MAYEPLTPEFDDFPQLLDDFPGTLVYRSPRRRSGNSLEARNRPIVELSDDESGESQQTQASRNRMPRQQHNREVISVSSTSDAEDSDMDIVHMPQLTHKRSRTGGNSLGGSPHTSARISGKRRATPADTRAMIGANPPQTVPDLQIRQRTLNNARTLPEPDLTDPGPSHGTQRKAKSPKKEVANEPPYYVDGRLDLKMYRGPGYERFPVALGTVEGQQELCDKWDAKLQARNEKKLANLQRAQHTLYAIDDESDSGDDSTDERKAAFEKRCLDSVAEVFPEVERAFILKKIREAPSYLQQSRNDDEDLVALGPPPLAENIISEVLEMEYYPRERSSNSKACGKGAALDGTGITVTWDRTQPKNEMYLKDGTILIAKNFPHVPTHFVDQMIKEKDSIFDTYTAIHDLEGQYYTLLPKPYPRRKQARIELEKKYMLKVNERRVPADYANRVNELQAAKQHVTREGIKDAAKKAKEEAEAANLAEHIKSGAVIECSCCYDAETPLNRVVPCTAEVPHNFCFVCVEGLADNQVGILKYEMLCMDDSGCTANLSREDVGRAIPITTFDRLELNQQQAEILAANIDGLEQCPSCDYKAICGEIKDEPVFHCQNPECSRASCRTCKKDDHTPKTCAEANTDKVLNARHLIEEARSQAIIRVCRKCKASILKDFGCNKMTCTRCGSLFCYNCNEDITHLAGNAYTHFGRKCILYDEQGRDRHDKEANEAEKVAISKATAMDAELDENKLRIDTGKDRTPEKRNRAAQNLLHHPAGGVFMQDLNNRAGRLNHRQLHMQNVQAHLDNLEAMQPNPELAAILAESRAMNGAFGRDNIPPPEVRMQQMQRLQDLHRRTQEAVARLGPPLAEPNTFDLATARLEYRRRHPNPARTPVLDEVPVPAAAQGINPAPNFQAPYPVGRMPGANWPDGLADLRNQYLHRPFNFDFDFGAPPAAMPAVPSIPTMPAVSMMPAVPTMPATPKLPAVLRMRRTPTVPKFQGAAEGNAEALAATQARRRALFAHSAAQRQAEAVRALNAGNQAITQGQQGDAEPERRARQPVREAAQAQQESAEARITQARRLADRAHRQASQAHMQAAEAHVQAAETQRNFQWAHRDYLPAAANWNRGPLAQYNMFAPNAVRNGPQFQADVDDESDESSEL